jgi:hypothetical protein
LPKYDDIELFFNKSMAFTHEYKSQPTFHEYCQFMGFSRSVAETYRRYSKAHFEVINTVLEFIDNCHEKTLYNTPAGSMFFLKSCQHLRPHRSINAEFKPLSHEMTS